MTVALDPLPRCCPQHTDWQTMANHLCRDFPTVPPEHVVRGILEAREGNESFDVAPDEAMATVELMVRYRLMLTIGEIHDAARTDPQTHHAVAPAPREGSAQ